MLPNGASSSRAQNGSLPTLPLVPGNGRPAFDSGTDLAVAYNHPVIGCYLSQAHRAASHCFLRRIDNFRPQAELGAVGELSRGIPVSHRRIYFGEKATPCAGVLGDYRVGMP